MEPGNVYKSLDSILNVFKNDKEFESSEIQDLLSIFSKKKCNGDVKRKNPLIVFEGLDGSGKSTITKIINELTVVKKLSTPPDCIKHLRSHFDNQPAELRTAFYSLGNYIAAEEIKDLLSESTVLLDRFWHSTSACALAKEAGDVKNLPQTESELYCWPDDLLKPDVVIFLQVPEHMRIERLSRRVNYTPEENRLEHDDDFRNAYITAFLRMRDPPVTEVLSIKAPKQTARLALKTITDMGVIIKRKAN